MLSIQSIGLILCIFFITTNGLEIIYPPELAGTKFATPRHLRIGPQQWDPVTCIIVSQNSNISDPIISANVTLGNVRLTDRSLWLPVLIAL